MQIIIIAIGPEHEARAAVIKTHYPEAVVVTSGDTKPEHAAEADMLTSRLVKVGFAKYIPQACDGPLCLLDSDVLVRDGAFDRLPPLTAGIAGVATQGASAKTHLPRPYLGQQMVGAMNSGVLFFADKAVATVISEAWSARYAAQRGLLIQDEPALYFALQDLGIAPQLLPEEFNSGVLETAEFLHSKKFTWADLNQSAMDVKASPINLSKLRIRRKLRDLGMEAELESFLASDPQARADWDDAMLIATDDPMLVAAIPAFAQAAGITEKDVMLLLRECV